MDTYIGRGGEGRGVKGRGREKRGGEGRRGEGRGVIEKSLPLGPKVSGM